MPCSLNLPTFSILWAASLGPSSLLTQSRTTHGVVLSLLGVLSCFPLESPSQACPDACPPGESRSSSSQSLLTVTTCYLTPTIFAFVDLTLQVKMRTCFVLVGLRKKQTLWIHASLSKACFSSAESLMVSAFFDWLLSCSSLSQSYKEFWESECLCTHQ